MSAAKSVDSSTSVGATEVNTLISGTVFDIPEIQDVCMKLQTSSSPISLGAVLVSSAISGGYAEWTYENEKGKSTIPKLQIWIKESDRNKNKKAAQIGAFLSYWDRHYGANVVVQQEDGSYSNSGIGTPLAPSGSDITLGGLLAEVDPTIGELAAAGDVNGIDAWLSGDDMNLTLVRRLRKPLSRVIKDEGLQEGRDLLGSVSGMWSKRLDELGKVETAIASVMEDVALDYPNSVAAPKKVNHDAALTKAVFNIYCHLEAGGLVDAGQFTTAEVCQAVINSIAATAQQITAVKEALIKKQ